jgi:selenocysteine-specific translation elongation factor
LPNPNNLNAVIDAIKISDTCLFVLSADNGIDEYGDYLFEMIYSFHLPTSIYTVQVIYPPVLAFE